MTYQRPWDRYRDPTRPLDGISPALGDALGRVAARSVARARATDEAARRARWAPTTQAFVERYAPFRLPTPWFHELWYAAYDDPAATRVFVQGPREFAKTSSILRYALRRLAEDHHVRVGVVSGTDPLAKLFLNELKHQLETNPLLTEVYGGPFVGERWSEHELVLRDARRGPRGIAGKDVSVFAVGRGGQISSRHCELLVVDDVETKDTVRSDLVRADTKAWFSKEVLPVVTVGGKVVATGTRKHHDDLYSTFLRPESGWLVVDAARTVWRPDGASIWPEMWSRAALEARRAELDAVDVLAWPQEYLNDPIPSDAQMFRPEDWPTYAEEPRDLAARLRLTIVQYWDLAISKREAADFTVGWTIGVDERNVVYLLDRARGHWDFDRQMSEIERMGRAWPGVTAVGIEQVAYQAAAVQEAVRRTLLPVTPVTPDRDKVARARLLEARARPGRVVRPAAAAWWPEFALEASYFPAGSHDDQVDALSGALRLAGWDTSSIGYAYGVWTCLSCEHKFVWAAGRPCPRCGTRAPAAFLNPDLLGAPDDAAVARA